MFLQIRPEEATIGQTHGRNIVEVEVGIVAEVTIEDEVAAKIRAKNEKTRKS